MWQVLPEECPIFSHATVEKSIPNIFKKGFMSEGERKGYGRAELRGSIVNPVRRYRIRIPIVVSEKGVALEPYVFSPGEKRNGKVVNCIVDCMTLPACQLGVRFAQTGSYGAVADRGVPQSCIVSFWRTKKDWHTGKIIGTETRLPRHPNPRECDKRQWFPAYRQVASALMPSPVDLAEENTKINAFLDHQSAAATEMRALEAAREEAEYVEFLDEQQSLKEAKMRKDQGDAAGKADQEAARDSLPSGAAAGEKAAGDSLPRREDVDGDQSCDPTGAVKAMLAAKDAVDAIEKQDLPPEWSMCRICEATLSPDLQCCFSCGTYNLQNVVDEEEDKKALVKAEAASFADQFEIRLHSQARGKRDQQPGSRHWIQGLRRRVKRWSQRHLKKTGFDFGPKPTLKEYLKYGEDEAWSSFYEGGYSDSEIKENLPHWQRIMDGGEDDHNPMPITKRGRFSKDMRVSQTQKGRSTVARANNPETTAMERLLNPLSMQERADLGKGKGRPAGSRNPPAIKEGYTGGEATQDKGPYQRPKQRGWSQQEWDNWRWREGWW